MDFAQHAVNVGQQFLEHQPKALQEAQNILNQAIEPVKQIRQNIEDTITTGKNLLVTVFSVMIGLLVIILILLIAMWITLSKKIINCV